MRCSQLRDRLAPASTSLAAVPSHGPTLSQPRKRPLGHLAFLHVARRHPPTLARLPAGYVHIQQVHLRSSGHGNTRLSSRACTTPSLYSIPPSRPDRHSAPTVALCTTRHIPRRSADSNPPRTLHPAPSCTGLSLTDIPFRHSRFTQCPSKWVLGEGMWDVVTAPGRLSPYALVAFVPSPPSMRHGARQRAVTRPLRGCLALFQGFVDVAFRYSHDREVTSCDA